jgi:hypothetical protein
VLACKIQVKSTKWRQTHQQHCLSCCPRAAGFDVALKGEVATLIAAFLHAHIPIDIAITDAMHHRRGRVLSMAHSRVSDNVVVIVFARSPGF